MAQFLTCLLAILLCLERLHSSCYAQSTTPYSVGEKKEYLPPSELDNDTINKARVAEKIVDLYGNISDGRKKRIKSSIAQADKTGAYWFNLAAQQAAFALKLRENNNKTIEEKRIKLIKKLNTDHTITTEEYTTSVKALEQERQTANAEAIKLDNLARYYEYYGINRNLYTFMPVRHRQHAPLYFNSNSTKRSAEILAKSMSTINPKTGKLSIYNELYGDYVGWWRLAFGLTVVGTNKGDATTLNEQTQEASIQRLVGGGGNGLMTAALPLATFHSYDEAVGAKINLLPKFATDLPQNGQPSSDFAYHSDLGVETIAYYSGFNSIITPYIYGRAGRIWGNKDFYENIKRNNHNGMSIIQVSAGIEISNALQLSINYNSGSSYIQKNLPLSIALSLLPKALQQ